MCDEIYTYIHIHAHMFILLEWLTGCGADHLKMAVYKQKVLEFSSYSEKD